MNIDRFVEKAKEKGFDTIAALSVEEARAAIAEWQSHIRDGDFAGFLITDPCEILKDAASLLILAYPYCTYQSYPNGIGRISGYYIASNRAYHAANELTGRLCGERVRAVRTHKLPQKPLARAAGLGRYGRNGIIVRNGSHIVLSVIVVGAELQLPKVQTPVPDCENCGRCESACPTGCLKDGYVEASRCLRTYMTSNRLDIPDDLRPLMGERLLGCDECLNACPGLKRVPMPDEFRRLFKWEILSDADRFAKLRRAIAELVGWNEAEKLHESAVWRQEQKQ